MAASGACREAQNRFFRRGVVLKEKDMKRNLTVLVLLVTWSLCFAPSLVSTAPAAVVPQNLDPSQNFTSSDAVVSVTGATDDDTGGDPGDAGDGYGIVDKPEKAGSLGGSGGVDATVLDECLLVLMSLIQLVL